jgi:hypothetical protein
VTSHHSHQEGKGQRRAAASAACGMTHDCCICAQSIQPSARCVHAPLPSVPTHHCMRHYLQHRWQPDNTNNIMRCSSKGAGKTHSAAGPGHQHVRTRIKRCRKGGCWVASDGAPLLLTHHSAASQERLAREAKSAPCSYAHNMALVSDSADTAPIQLRLTQHAHVRARANLLGH